MSDGSLPNAKSAHPDVSRDKLRRIVAARGLGGLANDTKWDEFINTMRTHQGPKPSFRFKCIDGPPSRWDTEWSYHLPFPLISVEWFDIGNKRTVWEPHRLKLSTVVEDLEWLIPILAGIGLDYRVGNEMIRIFGYTPRSLELFDEDVQPGGGVV